MNTKQPVNEQGELLWLSGLVSLFWVAIACLCSLFYTSTYSSHWPYPVNLKIYNTVSSHQDKKQWTALVSFKLLSSFHFMQDRKLSFSQRSDE